MFSSPFEFKFWNEVRLLIFISSLLHLTSLSEQFNTGCDEGLFECHSGRCISQSFICDGVADCGDGDMSDEQSCHLLTTPPPKPCANSEYQCNDRLCIPGMWVCDGEFDCTDGSDETHGCVVHVCDGFRCGGGSCIPKDWECDGVRDCPDNSDELHCSKKHLSTDECNIHDQKFLCHDDSKCININEVCNNHADCEDGSDEGGFCTNASKADACGNHTCPVNQGCIILPQGAMCTQLCSAGYHFVNGSCSDIDECSIFGQCDQVCKNYIGGHNCSCIHGYEFNAEKQMCRAAGTVYS